MTQAIEGRAIVASIRETRRRLQELEASLISSYEFKDIVFLPTAGAASLHDDFLRLRVYRKSDWPTKHVVLVRKRTTFMDIGKQDDFVMRREFDTEEDALSFVASEWPDKFRIGFEYERQGWQYDLKGRRVFVEDIVGFEPTVEAEATSSAELQSIFDLLDISRQLHEPIPEMMRKLLT